MVHHIIIIWLNIATATSIGLCKWNETFNTRHRRSSCKGCRGKAKASAYSSICGSDPALGRVLSGRLALFPGTRLGLDTNPAIKTTHTLVHTTNWALLISPQPISQHAGMPVGTYITRTSTNLRTYSVTGESAELIGTPLLAWHLHLYLGLDPERDMLELAHMLLVFPPLWILHLYMLLPLLWLWCCLLRCWFSIASSDWVLLVSMLLNLGTYR